MGRRRRWFSKLKRALGSDHKKLRFAKHGEGAENDESNVLALRGSEQEPDMLVIRTVDDTVVDIPWSILEQPYVSPVVQNANELNEIESGEMDKVDNASSVAVELTHFGGELGEGAAAMRIQKAFRQYKAKGRLRDLRGVVRLKALMQGSSTKRQTAATLQCMQTLSRVQSQIRSRRMRMCEENQALQRQLQEKHEKEMEKMKLSIGDDWNDSIKSKEKLEASLRYRQEAAIRRERALAYAHSRQQKWKNGLKAADPVFMDPVNPHWGWSWLERWMAARPWESSNVADTDAIRPLSVDEISKAYYAHRDRHPHTTKPLLIPQRSSRISTRLPSKTPSASSKATKLKSPTSKSGSVDCDEDSKSICSVQTCTKQRRHSVASSSMSHNARLSARTTASSEAHKARLHKSSSSSAKVYGRLETGLSKSGSVKKRESYSPSPNPSAARRHSGPPKVDLSSIKNTNLRS